MENREALVEMKTWLDSEPAEFVEFVGRLLSSLPDGENDVYEPIVPDGMGWKEMELIANLLNSIENGKDVKVALRYLFGI